jgi:N-acetylated-alpha-linked acidic dipeptidase
MIFATWDAEEWGLVGSTEYVEDDAAKLLYGAVANLNQDVAAQGPRFGGGGSPSIRAVLRDIANSVEYPGDTVSVYAMWRRQSGVSDSLEPPMGDPGGGSDFAGFYNHLGIPHSDWGFGGAGGVYHSAYDSFWWMSRFGDPGFERHAAAARIGAALLMRLAGAEVLPYDYVEYAATMRRYVPPIERGLARLSGELTADVLRDALDAFERSASEFASERDAALTRSLSRTMREQVNASLLGVERALTRPNGLHGRPWYRNVIYASDRDNGYATMPFPTVNEAIRAENAELARAEIADLAQRFRAATTKLDEARRALVR